MNRKILTAMLWVALPGLGLSFPASATVFAIDSFSIYRDGNLFFEDNFDDGVLPPITGWTYPSGIVAEYSTVGDPGPEENDRLYLDTSLGNAQNSEVTGSALLVQRNRLRTNTVPDPNSGLKQNHDIKVFGTFDLIAPELNQERYSIRLTDFQTDYDANDNVDMGIRRTADGELMVAFREADFDTGEMNVLGQYMLTADDFSNYDQITFGLFHVGGSTEVYGGYSLLGSGGATDFTIFDVPGNIFDGEVWTRAAFIATQHVTGVPAPASLALMLAGLVGVGCTRKKAR